MDAKVADRSGITRRLAGRAAATGFDDLPDDIVERSIHCVLDFFAVTLAGIDSPPIAKLIAAAREEAPQGAAGLVGDTSSTSPFWAAWINGAAAHVHVYDDVNMAVPGHGSAVTLPAIFALAGENAVTGWQAIEAFVAGYETTCAIGKAMAPSHYEMGFHASSTIGGFGAAAAAGRLMRLSGDQIADAFGAASTMSGGLKAVFGTMAKSVQVGRAAATGVVAARLARAGLATGGTILEHPQGFVSVYSRADPQRLAEVISEDDFALRQNLFKYFAACYMAHAPIECALALREEAAAGGAIARITATVHPAVANVCNIERPTTALEAKYSLRAVIAMGLSGISPGRLENFEKISSDYEDIEPLAAVTHVDFDDRLSETECELLVELSDGRRLVHHHDAGRPVENLKEQRDRLEEKFDMFVEPLLGGERTKRLKAAISDLPALADISSLLELTRRS